MEARLLRRPVATLFSGHSQCLLALNAASSRHESSYRRSRSRLNVKPEPSFLPSYSKAPVQQDHIIFNPPSSAPSVLHTPLSFLPKEDKRKQLLVATAKKFSPSTPMRLPPPIRTKPKVPHHHLSDADIAEILKLKHQDPDHWTNAKLARKFNCSSLFISICLTQCTADNTKRKLELKQKKEAIEARWGPRRRKAREEQERRFQLAYRGA
ncbi:Mitochondrial ribosomal protein subunit L20 domain containing protein [Hyaloscypha variabilis]